MLTFLVYLWLKLDTILICIAAIPFLYLVGLVLYFLWNFFEVDSWGSKKAATRLENLKVNLKKRLVICISILLIVAAIPNSNQMAVLAATHYTQELVQSEEGQKIVQLVRKKAAKYLDEQLKEIDEGVANKTQEVVDVVKK